MNPIVLYEFLRIIDKRKRRREMERLYLLNNIQTGKIITEISEIKIPEFLENFIKEKEENGIFFEIHYEIPVEEATVETDKKYLNLILSEIIENSKTGIPKSGIIRINIKKKNLFIIEISDSGIGIPRKDIDKIFEPFYITNFHQFKGHLGIGLSIVKGLLKYLGGKIEIESQIGKGTKVSIYLT